MSHDVNKIPPYVWVWKGEYSALLVSTCPPVSGNHSGFIRADIVAEKDARIAELEADVAANELREQQLVDAANALDAENRALRGGEPSMTLRMLRDLQAEINALRERDSRPPTGDDAPWLIREVK